MTDKNIQRFRTLLSHQLRHWLEMCQDSESDYDIHYFGGRSIICDNLNIKIIKNEIKTIDQVIKYLENEKTEINGYYVEFFEDNNFYDETMRGNIDECEFLLKIANQKYC
jgi:hypothetical protein